MCKRTTLSGWQGKGFISNCVHIEKCDGVKRIWGFILKICDALDILSYYYMHFQFVTHLRIEVMAAGINFSAVLPSEMSYGMVK